MEGVFFIKTEEEMTDTYGNFRINYPMGWNDRGMDPLLGKDVTDIVLGQMESRGEILEDWENADMYETFYFEGFSFERNSIRINTDFIINKTYKVQQNGLFTT